MRHLHNRRFLHRELRKGLEFDGCRLDVQQHEAVIACEDAQLVLASAGSGKTLSLMAKIRYLVAVLKIPPPQILVISFTNKTVRELVERCPYPDVEIRTFHSLGNSLLQFIERRDLGRRRLVTAESQLAFVRRYIWRQHCENPQFARAFNDFLLFYYSSPQSVGAHQNHQQKVRFNQRYLRRALAAQAPRSKELELVAN